MAVPSLKRLSASTRVGEPRWGSQPAERGHHRNGIRGRDDCTNDEGDVQRETRRKMENDRDDRGRQENPRCRQHDDPSERAPKLAHVDLIRRFEDEARQQYGQHELGRDLQAAARRDDRHAEAHEHQRDGEGTRTRRAPRATSAATPSRMANDSTALTTAPPCSGAALRKGNTSPCYPRAAVPPTPSGTVPADWPLAFAQYPRAVGRGASVAAGRPPRRPRR